MVTLRVSARRCFFYWVQSTPRCGMMVEVLKRAKWYVLAILICSSRETHVHSLSQRMFSMWIPVCIFFEEVRLVTDFFLRRCMESCSTRRRSWCLWRSSRIPISAPRRRCFVFSADISGNSARYCVGYDCIRRARCNRELSF